MGVWFIYLILAAFPGTIAFAAAYRFYEVKQASRWPSVPGRVVVSTSVARPVKYGGPKSNDTEPRNFAKIEYEYALDGRKLRGSRVSLGTDMGDLDVAETISQFPVGSDVQVFYNPKRPDYTVLERDMPPGLMRGAVYVVLGVSAAIIGFILGFQNIGAIMPSLIGNPAKAPFVTACVCFSALFALVTMGLIRNVSRAFAWPTARGRILSSNVRQYQDIQDDYNGNRRMRNRHRSSIVYSYEVAGVRYTGDKVGTAGRYSSTIPSMVGQGTAAYHSDSAVDVRYNPLNPAESILNPRIGPLWLLWLVPFGILAMGYFVGR